MLNSEIKSIVLSIYAIHQIQVTMSDLEALSPGEMIAKQIKAKGLTQKAVASISGIDQAVLSRIIKSGRSIDPDTALKLQEAIDINAFQLLEAQLTADFKIAQAGFKERDKIKEARAVYEFAPTQEMINRGWLPGVKKNSDLPSLAEGLKKFYDLEDLTQIPAIPHAAKKTNEMSLPTPSQIAWLQRAKQKAQTLKIDRSFNENLMEECFAELHPLLREVSSVTLVADILKNYGIRLVFIEKLKSSKIDGACLWINGKNDPVVAMSLRYDRIDNFWFILRHELEHVRKGEGKSWGEMDNIETMEDEANQAFQHFIDPKNSIAEFIKTNGGHISSIAVEKLATALKIHPGLVAGQVHHLTQRYALFRQYLAPFRNSLVTQGNNIDGWT